IALNRGLLDSDMEDHLAENLLKPVIKLDIKALTFDESRIIEAMKQDKKRTGKHLALVMLVNNNNMEKVNDLTEEEALAALAEFKKTNAVSLVQ
ncbi:MAG: hypothetical protein C4562_01970, partial [Actinobacteria bacterium]